MSTPTRVLVAEKIGDSGIELLREHFDVDLGADWSAERARARIGDYDGDPDPLGDQARRAS